MPLKIIASLMISLLHPGDCISLIPTETELHLDWTWAIAKTAPRSGIALTLKEMTDDIPSPSSQETALLYWPKDTGFALNRVKQGATYDAQLRVIKQPEQIPDLTSSIRFLLETPRIVNENEAQKVLEKLSKLREEKIKILSTAVTFKFSNKIKEHYNLEVAGLTKKGLDNATIVQVVPDAKTVIVKDLHPASLVAFTLKKLSENKPSPSSVRILYFTGSIVVPQANQPAANPLSRLFFYNKNKEINEEMVTCYVEKRRPFMGFPCANSNVCIPLNWKCDGEYDCIGGSDEMNCTEAGLIKLTEGKQRSKLCKKTEFLCLHNSVPMCLPHEWLCDGRKDCSDGWDERKENCQTTAYTFSALTQGIKKVTNALTRCRYNYFRCRYGGCIPERLVCNGRPDCDDGSDEYYCDDDDDDGDDYDEYEGDYDFRCHPQFEFKCYRSRRERRCIPRPWVCDAHDDCPLGEDEYDDICAHQVLYQGYIN